jgi:CDP-glycerol glycerophosphotransferase
VKNILIDLIKDIAFFIINGWRKFIYLICSCFKIDNKKVFVNYFDGRGIGDHPKYIVKELIKECPNIKIYWVYRGKKEAQNNIIFVKPFSVKAIFHQATAKIWISSVRMPFYSIKKQKQYYFQSWHGGLAFKKIEQECEAALSKRYKRTCKHDSKMIDYWISSNADNTRLYKNFFWYHGGEILEVGSPRNDIFFNITNEQKKLLKKKFNIKDEKIVVYAPTFRKNNSFDAYDLNLIKLTEILEQEWGGKWKLVIRLHPRLLEKSNTFIQYNEKIIDGTKIEDIQELLAITDLLITDYSSIALDYMITRNPVIIYASDIDEYKKDRDFHLKLEDTPFPVAISQKELEKIIKEFNLQTYQYKLNDFINEFKFFDDGTASQKIVKLICKLIEDK